MVHERQRNHTNHEDDSNTSEHDDDGYGYDDGVWSRGDGEHENEM